MATALFFTADTYKVCAPARASFLTGRFPFHLAATKTNFAYFWTLEGTNLTYTMFPEKLQKAGYKTHMVGKCACVAWQFTQSPLSQRSLCSVVSALSRLL